MSLFPPPQAAARLVTQNLLISAAAAAQPDRYVTEENVVDLATVISLSCLYDRLVLLGPRHLLDFNSPLLAFLRTDVVEIRDIADSEWKRSVERAQKYCSAFLRTTPLPQATEVFEEIYSMSRRYGLDLEPDGPGDVETGKRLLENVGSSKDLRAKLENENDWIVTAYVLRTFLYIGFSDHLRIPIAVDRARQEFVSEIADDSQVRVREAVFQTISDGLRSNRSLSQPVRSIASPFAAIAFNEAIDRAQLVTRAKELRRELLDFRLKLRPLEEALETAVGDERDEPEAKLAAALEALSHRYSVKSTQDLRIRRIVADAKPVAKALSLDISDALERTAEKLIVRDAENTLAELHELKRKLPSTAGQDSDIKRLFGL
jgi:hypothetical protein